MDCIELQEKSGRHGDDFYRCLKTLRKHVGNSRQSKKAADRCKILAGIYDRSLDEFLVSLKEQQPSNSVAAEIAKALEFKRALNAETELIS